jgi:hypothetical protein
MKEHFEIIILMGRPASGKSEVIDYLKKTPIPERLERFHINGFEEIDDFPMLWTWFEEDAILEKIMHKPRVHSDSDGYFLHPYQWNLLIERISLEYQKKLRDEGYAENMTTIIEFSRGSEHGMISSKKHAFCISMFLMKNLCAKTVVVSTPTARIRSWNMVCRITNWSVCIRTWIGKTLKGRTLNFYIFPAIRYPTPCLRTCRK